MVRGAGPADLCSFGLPLRDLKHASEPESRIRTKIKTEKSLNDSLLAVNSRKNDSVGADDLSSSDDEKLEVGEE